MAYIKGNSYGNDIDGTSYSDLIEGLGGADLIFGYAGNDDIYGGSGDDELYGGSGDDELLGGTGWDYMAGGTGNDSYAVDSINDEVVEYAGEGIDTVHTILTAYTLPVNVEDLVYDGYSNFRGTGNSLSNYIYGGDYADTIQGLAGNDRLFGYAGDDTLVGGSGADRLSGGAGYDWLFGGSGNDVLTGGTGQDDFHFDTKPGAGNVDQITDFDVGEDAIYLNRDIYTGIWSDGVLSTAAYWEGTTAHDSSDRIVYDQGTGKIFYDPDGIGGAAQVLFATVTPGTDLASVDFYGY
ncbi:MAG TPA: calcium-binding protein [Allosphingosinicella sp.]|jgi:Ca2+-binding RTX toxin-like protein|nr:calcium-binding protein [Allosphingosinicella sp.]